MKYPFTGFVEVDPNTMPPNPTPVPTPTPGEYVRPYGPNAPWNVPVGGIGVRSDSADWARMHYNDSPDRPGNFNCSFVSYTYPVFNAADATGMFTARIRSGTPLDGQQIPWNPAWGPAAGSDAQVIILDEATGREWNLWQVRVAGNEVFASNGSLVPGNYFTYEGGNPPSRGIGIQYLAMLVRPEEIEEGIIEHALSMPIKNPNGEFFVPPATKLEHSHGRGGIPEGMRFALRVEDSEIDAWASQKPSEWQGFCKAVATALRDYGWFITDTSGSAHFQFEATASAGDKWRDLGLDVTGGTARDILDGLITQDRIYALVDSSQY